MELFLQWQKISNLPVMLDSENLLELRVVPIVLLIDEAGIVRHRNPKPAQIQTFLNAPPAKSTKPPKPQTARSHQQLVKAVEENPKDAQARFELGVSFRKRYDSTRSEDADFGKAVAQWREALRLDPGNYIWRRRLQQYGPRLDKPYSFYDWVTNARKDIQARGEKPVPLSVEPSGAEFAQPLRGKNTQAKKNAPIEHPDPQGKLPISQDHIVQIHAVRVPHTDPKQEVSRIHVQITPTKNELGKPTATWNHEAGPSLGFLNGSGFSLEGNTLTQHGEIEITTKSGTLDFYLNLCLSDGTCVLIREQVAIPK